MSVEDDSETAEVELRDLVTQTLEDNGLLSKIKAQLRAGLYLALESDINSTDLQLNYNTALKSKLSKPDIRTIFCLVHEFLEYFELNFTCSVFEKETFCGTSYTFENREKLIQELDIGIDTLQDTPLLLEILNIARASFNLSTHNLHKGNNTTYEVQTEQNESLSDTSQRDVKIGLNESEIIPNNSPNKDVDEKTETDDTYEGTSSIADDSDPKLIDLDKSVKRKSDKFDKLKPMSGLTSLSDLPPLQLNKSRNSDTVLLPSLYSKDFREKSSLKEIDKLLEFDSLDNYEEDFMSYSSGNNKLEINVEKQNGNKDEKNETNTSSISENVELETNVDDSNDSDSMKLS